MASGKKQPHDNDTVVPGRFADRPLSHGRVWLVLDRADDPLSAREIADRGRMHPTTARAALSALRDDDEVVVSVDPADVQRPLYSLPE
jgi:predicted ArsR family transcriptional regulator